MRAHEAHAEGVAVSKGARVFTVFSTSKDHNQGSQAMAGCILVDFEKMQVINRSPAYKNQYVHRRDSVSIAMLSEAEIKQRIKLGLITLDPNDNDDTLDIDGDFDPEEWDEFQDDEEDEVQTDADTDDDEDNQYVIDTRRASAVNPENTMASPPGSSHDNHEHPFWTQNSNTTNNHVVQPIDFSHVSTKSRKKKEIMRLSSLEENELEAEGQDMEDIVWEECHSDEKHDNKDITPSKRSAATSQNTRYAYSHKTATRLGFT
mmetsp:Transcript_430/g.559  ORF Transcript_430/g.559 Transcript_430/m.559 type:complete len:261 (+) Transcript_430:44-826(+)